MTPDEHTAVLTRTTALCQALVQALGPDMARDLEQFAADILADPMQDFLATHGPALARVVQGDTHQTDLVLAFVLGWMLGYPGAKATPDRAEAVLLECQLVAAYAAGLSSVAMHGAARRHVS